jgi:hypothetical protein
MPRISTIAVTIISLWCASTPAGLATALAQAPAIHADTAGWVIAPAAHADLWFHAMAVIGVDPAGPLGLYNAEYAQVIRETKREAGVYPTPLDREAPSLRRRLSDSLLQSFHFLPLWFPDATPERLLDEVSNVTAERVRVPMGGGGVGPMVLAQLSQDGRARQLLATLVDVMREEWKLFYRDYHARFLAQHASEYAVMQELWDDRLAGPLAPFLERRRLTSGRVMPSPPIGPEGRIVGGSEFVADDQVVAVQYPPPAEGPEESVFAFLKELCFLLIDDRMLREAAPEEKDLESLQRRAAVRCGALIVEFYTPELSARYRRVFLDAVGAEAKTVGAFERIYPLPPPLFVAVREAIRER